MRAFSLWVFLICIGCSSGSGGGGGAGSGATGGNAGFGGTGGVAGSGTGGVGGGTLSPFTSELCNDAFCWEEPKPFAGQVNALATTAQSVWAAGEGMLARRIDGVWTVAPTPDGIGFEGIFAFDDSNVWAVGAGGAILHWDGTAITKVDSPVTSTLFGIWGAAPDDIWAAGDAAQILHYNGSAWTSIQSAGAELRAVWGTGPSDVYVVGGTLNIGHVLHFDGSSWSSFTSGLFGAGLNAVGGTDANNVFAVGNYGYLYELFPDPNEQYLAQTGGMFWGLSVVGPDDVLATGNDSLYRWKGAGFESVAPIGGRAIVRDPTADRHLIGGEGISEWSEAGGVVAEIAAPVFEEVWLGEGNRGIAVSSDGKVLAKDGASWTALPNLDADAYQLHVGGVSNGVRIILSSVNTPGEAFTYDGSSVKSVPAPPVDYLFGDSVISGTSTSDMWIFAYDGAAHSAGGDWQVTAWPEVSGNSFSPRAALAVSPSDVWVVGGLDTGSPGGAIAHYDGNTWTRSTVGPTNTVFHGIAKLGDKLYASGGFLDEAKPKDLGGFTSYPQEPVLYEKNGANWTKLTVPGLVGEYDGAATAFLAASATALYFVLPASHGSFPNLTAYDGTSFTSRPYPATECRAAFVTDGTLRLVAGNNPYGILRQK